MNVKHYSIPQVRAQYQYFVEHENNRYIYNRVVDNKGSESFLIDSKSNEPLPYEKHFKLVDFLDTKFNDNTINSLEKIT